MEYKMMEYGCDFTKAESEDEDSLVIDSEEDGIMDVSETGTSRGPDSIASDSEFDDLGINMENKNTQRKTDTDIRILITYFRSINEMRSPENIPPMELDRYLSTFFSIVKKHDGNEYEPASLRGMLCSVERFLKMKNYQSSVTRDLIFANTRHALKLKQQKLRELGKGSRKTTEPFGKVTLDKVNQLFSAHEMGPYTPMSVINTLCFMFIVHFRLRKAIDHKNLLWGDIKLRTEQNGREYLVYEAISVSDSASHLKRNEESTNGKFCVFAQKENPERDPIGIYKLYSEKRPQNMQYDNSPFYLGITTLHPSPLQAWYRTCAMGVNKLSDLVRMIRDMTGLPRATLHDPAESLLAESYSSSSKNTFTIQYPKHHISFPMSNYAPILPKPEGFLHLTDGRASLKRIQAHINPTKSCNDNINVFSDGHTQSKSEIQNFSLNNHKLNIGSSDTVDNIIFNPRVVTNEDKPDQRKHQPEVNCRNSQSDDRNINSVRQKFLDMVQTLDERDVKRFDLWLKTIKLHKDSKTGGVCYEESTDNKVNDDSNTSTDHQESTDEQASESTTITLNITLSPQALQGNAPPVVSAVSNVKKKADSRNDKEKVLQKTTEEEPKIVSRDINSTVVDKPSIKREIVDSDTDSSAVSVPKMNRLSEKPVNLTTKSTPINISTDTAKSHIRPKVHSKGSNSQSISTPVLSSRGDKSFLMNNPAVDLPHLSGLWGIPHAHTSDVAIQKIPKCDGRDLGLFIPVSLSYPLPNFEIAGNMMTQNGSTSNNNNRNAHVTTTCGYFPYNVVSKKQSPTSAESSCVQKEASFCVSKASVESNQKLEPSIN